MITRSHVEGIHISNSAEVNQMFARAVAIEKKQSLSNLLKPRETNSHSRNGLSRAASSKQSFTEAKKAKNPSFFHENVAAKPSKKSSKGKPPQQPVF